MEVTVAAQCVESIRHRVAMLVMDTQNVASEKDHLAHVIFVDYANRLEKLAVLLKYLQQDLESHSVGYFEVDKNKMEEEVHAAEKLINDYRDRCSLYLLLSCPRLLKGLLLSSKNLIKGLELLVPDTCSLSSKLQVSQIQQLLEQNSPSLSIKQQAIVDMLGMDTLDLLVLDTALGNELSQQIAEYLGVTITSADFKKEISKLKAEEEVSDSREDRAFCLYLKQCLQIFEKATALSSSQPVAGGQMGCIPAACPPSRHITANTGPLQPLQSFICPITKEVMRDPVQIASGQTYERSAIQKWFAAGHSRCPMGVDLKNTKMKSNFALRQSIAEWRERNCASRLDIAERALLAADAIDFPEQVDVVTDLQALCEEDTLNKYAIATKGLIGPLVHLLGSKNVELRMKTCATLQSLALDNDDNQDLMVESGVIELIVRCLARPYDEALQAVLLLQQLSHKPRIAERISHAQGSVLLLVTLLGCEEEELLSSVKVVLRNVPMNDENIVIMAKANMLTPLVTRLVTGSMDSKIVMAKTLAELHMPDSSKAEASSHDSITILTNMMNSARDEERDPAISALKNLSNVAAICQLIAQCSGLEVLVRLLTSTKSSPNLRIGAANIISNLLVALGDDWAESGDRNTEIESLTNTFLSFINPCMPSEVQAHLLRGLLGLAKGKDTALVAKEKMKGGNAFAILIPSLKKSVAEEVRHSAVQLFESLSTGSGQEVWAALKQQLPENLLLLVEMIQNSGCVGKEAVPAMRILAVLPKDDALITSVLVQSNVIPVLAKYVGFKSDAAVEEAAAGALLRFTSASNVDLQHKLAQLGVISRLVNLLDVGKAQTKVCAARALAQFSTSTPKLVRSVQRPSCFDCFSRPPEVCQLHAGFCTVESTFCLLEADAVTPLLTLLKEREPRPVEAALIALSTLVDDSVPGTSTWERGCHAIAGADGIPLIIKVLSKGRPRAQELAVNMCEKIFRLEKYRDQFGTSAQMHIITVAQNGGPNVRHTAGKILRQLELLHTQSDYSGHSTSSSAYSNITQT